MIWYRTPAFALLAALGAAAIGMVSVHAQTAPAPAAAPAPPTPTRVGLPADFAKTFQLYDKVDKADRKITRFLYVNKDALAKVKPGEPFPDGMVIVMEDHEVALESGGAPMKGAGGKLMPTSRIRAIAVMEKQAGWGSSNPFPAELDNGDWEYASFKADGSANAISLQTCHTCHLPMNKDGLDFTFSGAKIREAATKK